MRKQINTVKEAWAAIESGKTVYWNNEAYRLTLCEVEGAHGFNVETAKYQKTHHSYKNNYVLRVTCTSNWFGSLLNENEVSQLFINEVF
jgi:hypothetical protein